MITVHFVAPGGTSTALECKPGQSLMQAAVGANLPGIEADCGGLMTCGTCHVLVRAPHDALLPPMSDDESGMLDFTSTPRQPHSRLSCQIDLTQAMDGLTVDLPPNQH